MRAAEPKFWIEAYTCIALIISKYKFLSEMSYFLDHEVDFFKSCRSVTVTLEGKNDPGDKTLQNNITRSHLRRHPCKNQTKMKFLWQGSKIQIVSIFAHK